MDYLNWKRLSSISNYGDIDKIKNGFNITCDEYIILAKKVLLEEIKAHISFLQCEKKIKAMQEKMLFLEEDMKTRMSSNIVLKLSEYMIKKSAILISVRSVEADLERKLKSNKLISQSKMRTLTKYASSINSTYLHLNVKCAVVSSKVALYLNKNYNENKTAKEIEKLNSQLEKNKNIILRDSKRIANLSNQCDKKMKTLSNQKRKLFIISNKRTNYMFSKMIKCNEKCSVINNLIKKVETDYADEIKEINKIYSKEFEQNGENMCPICLEEDCRTIKTECGHYFHVECIVLVLQEALKSPNRIEIKCPMCRQVLK